MAYSVINVSLYYTPCSTFHNEFPRTPLIIVSSIKLYPWPLKLSWGREGENGKRLINFWYPFLGSQRVRGICGKSTETETDVVWSVLRQGQSSERLEVGVEKTNDTKIVSTETYGSLFFFFRRYEDALADIQEAVRLVPHGNSDIRHVLFRLRDDVQNKLSPDQTSETVAGPSSYLWINGNVPNDNVDNLFIS